jgi:ABC-type lipoprotein release transport system permease subunit
MNWWILILTGRALRGRLTRTILTFAGISAVSMLIILLLATHHSLTSGIGTYIQQPGIDLWAAPKGTDNLIRASAIMPVFIHSDVAEHEDVADTSPIFRSFVNVRPFLETEDEKDSRGRRLNLLGIGYNTENNMGGPSEISEGRSPENLNDVVLDRAAAHRLRVKPGDSIRVNNEVLFIAGLSRGTNLLATQFLFIDIEYIWQTFGYLGEASFMTIQLEPGKDSELVRKNLEKQFHELDFFSISTFLNNNLHEVASGLLPIIGIVALLGISVAVVLIVLLIQGLVEDRRSDIAILLSLGNSVINIVSGLVFRAAFLGLCGCVFGGLLAAGLVIILDHFAPHVEFAYNLRHFLLVTAIFVPVGMLASVVPVMQLRHIDPFEVFRA